MFKKLTRAESFKLAKWMDEKYEVIGKMTRQEATQEASKFMGREMVVSALEGVLKDMGRPAPFIIKRAAEKKERNRRVEFMASQLIKVISELERLYLILNEKFDPQNTFDRKALSNIANKVGNYHPMKTEGDSVTEHTYDVQFVHKKTHQVCSVHVSAKNEGEAKAKALVEMKTDKQGDLTSCYELSSVRRIP